MINDVFFSNGHTFGILQGSTANLFVCSKLALVNIEIFKFGAIK